MNNFDYSSSGAYFITICTQNRQCILSHIVGRGLAPAKIDLTRYGSIAEEQLMLLKKRYSFVQIREYVIMPNHIHFILTMSETAGASPRPTVTDVICAYKSLTARECNRVKPINKLFQTSFYEHIIRNQHDYDEIAAYILENPSRWEFDKMYSGN